MADSRRTGATWIISAVFLFFSLNALVQVVMRLLHMNTDPAALTVLQFLTGTAALIAAVTAWRASPRAWVWSLIYGATAVLLLGSLGPILDLEREEVSGIWVGAGMLAALSAVFAWYLRRIAAPDAVRHD